MPSKPNDSQHRLTLSQQEMCSISQAISRDFSPRLFASRLGRRERMRFAPQELREISRLISRDFAPSRVSHQPSLVLLAVSPRRLYAYWHVAKRLLNNALQRTAPEPMTLRIYAQSVDSTSPVNASPEQENWFDVVIDNNLGQQDVWVPERFSSHGPRQFSAVLGKKSSDHPFQPITFSNSAAVPHSLPPLLPPGVSNVLLQSIMPVRPASSAGKTASSQGK